VGKFRVFIAAVARSFGLYCGWHRRFVLFVCCFGPVGGVVTTVCVGKILDFVAAVAVVWADGAAGGELNNSEFRSYPELNYQSCELNSTRGKSCDGVNYGCYRIGCCQGLGQLGVTRVELPELRTQLNSGGNWKELQRSQLLVTAFGSPLPYLVRSHTKPNNSVSQIVLPRSGLVRSGSSPISVRESNQSGPGLDRSLTGPCSLDSADRWDCSAYLFWA